MSGGLSRAETALERLHRLYPNLIDLKLERLRRLLAALDHPERRLPPVIHVAGTNGKGSTIAFMRAMAEAGGLRVHVYTSPHLVRFNERIRVAGELVSDAALAEALDAIEAANGDAPVTVFEAMTAAAFWLFARTPADLCLLEVGLGGRFDATNVVARPAACAITAISLDHREFLGEDLAAIAAEKAGIIKPGVPVVCAKQPAAALAVIEQAAKAVAAPLLRRGLDWEIFETSEGLEFEGRRMPPPGLVGAHQAENAGIAMHALRLAGVRLGPGAVGDGIRNVEWPARLQRLHGALARLLPTGSELWLDGAHNPGGAAALAAQLREWTDAEGGPTVLVVGMKQSKDVAEFLNVLLPHAAGVFAVAEPGQHLALPVAEIVAASGGVAVPGPDVTGALRQITAPTRVLICGSLYLAGEVLKLDEAA